MGAELFHAGGPKDRDMTQLSLFAIL